MAYRNFLCTVTIDVGAEQKLVCRDLTEAEALRQFDDAKRSANLVFATVEQQMPSGTLNTIRLFRSSCKPTISRRPLKE